MSLDIRPDAGQIGDAGPQSALTDADGSTVDGTYGTEERDVIQNLVARQAEIEAVLEAFGLIE